MVTAALVSIRGDQVTAGEGAGRALLGITDVSVVVKRIGDPAIRTYQELVRHGSRFSEHDIARIHERVTKAREILAS